MQSANLKDSTLVFLGGDGDGYEGGGTECPFESQSEPTGN